MTSAIPENRKDEGMKVIQKEQFSSICLLRSRSVIAARDAHHAALLMKPMTPSLYRVVLEY